MSVIVLETDRLILRHFAPEDLDDLATIYADPDVMRHIGTGACKTREQTAAMMEFDFTDNRRAWSAQTLSRLPQLARATDREAHFSLWATVLKSAGRLVGRCGLHAWDLDGRKEVEVGYVLAKAYWRRGLATEAARAVRDYGFEKLGFDRLISVIQPANGASQRVAEKIGMSHEKDLVVGERPVRIYAIERAPHH